MISTQEPIVRAVLAPPDYAQRIEYLERKVESMRVWLLAMIVLYGFVIGVLVLQVGSDLLSR
jgi:tetrahydromethanopterin S-methyltransferase subunit G